MYRAQKHNWKKTEREKNERDRKTSERVQAGKRHRRRKNNKLLFSRHGVKHRIIYMYTRRPCMECVHLHAITGSGGGMHVNKVKQVTRTPGGSR